MRARRNQTIRFVLEFPIEFPMRYEQSETKQSDPHKRIRAAFTVKLHRLKSR